MATVAAIATVFSLASSRTGRKQAQHARKLKRKGDRLKAGRNSLKQVKQAQILRARSLQLANNQGTEGSSASQGGLGAIQSQTGGNIGFAQTLSIIHQQASARLDASSQSLGQAQAFSSVGTFAANNQDFFD